ncbi:MAG: AbrB/MazE/SpoVT family DNA-binding domain-containing protein [Oscillospiraceae bacterium]|nr:AbrB/MazE/SpoVT family DNA-binding domain-containing protein [Oscillospiraceae bacterium]
MHSTGIFRRVDGLGRFVLPKELRKSLDINQNDYLQIFLEGDTIVLRKRQDNCILCGGTESLTDFHDKCLCTKCIEELKSKD